MSTEYGGIDYATWYKAAPFPTLGNISSYALPQCGELALTTARVSAGDFQPYNNANESDHLFTYGIPYFFGVVCAYFGLAALYNIFVLWRMAAKVDGKTNKLARALREGKQSEEQNINTIRKELEDDLHKLHSSKWAMGWAHGLDNLLFWGVGIVSFILILTFGNGTSKLIFTYGNRMLIGLLAMTQLFAVTGILSAYRTHAVEHSKLREWHVVMQNSMFTLINMTLVGYLIVVQAESASGNARAFTFSAGTIFLVAWPAWFLFLLVWRMLGHCFKFIKPEPEPEDVEEEEDGKGAKAGESAAMMVAVGKMPPTTARNKAVEAVRHAHFERDMLAVQILAYASYCVAGGLVAGQKSSNPQYQFYFLHDWTDSIVTPVSAIFCFVALQWFVFGFQLIMVWAMRPRAPKTMKVNASSDDMEAASGGKNKMKNKRKGCAKWCADCCSTTDEEEEQQEKPVAAANTGGSIYW